MAQLLPDKERQRPLAYLLLVVAVIVFYYLFMHRFIVRHVELNETISQLADQEARFIAAIRERPELEARLEEVREMQDQVDYFLEQTTANLAQSELNTRLKQMISLHAEQADNCQVLSQQNLRPDDEERFQRVAIKVRMRCEVDDLGRVLYHLESGTPYLFVENVTIFRQVTRRRRGRELVEEKMLDVRFDLSGYLREPAA